MPNLPIGALTTGRAIGTVSEPGLQQMAPETEAPPSGQAILVVRLQEPDQAQPVQTEVPVPTLQEGRTSQHGSFPNEKEAYNNKRGHSLP